MLSAIATYTLWSVVMNYTYNPRTERLGVGDDQAMVRIRISPADNSALISGLYNIVDSDINVVRCYRTLDDLPACIAEPIQVLNMCEVDSEVEGVGWKCSENVFWVVVDIQDLRKVDISNGEKDDL